MQRTNEKYLESQMLKALNKENSDNLKFIIHFDPQEKKEPSTNFDEILVFWVLPEKIGKPLDLKSVCECLVTGYNEIPLWIKVQTNQPEIYDLFISKRFRKLDVIADWHKENKYKPIIII